MSKIEFKIPDHIDKAALQRALSHDMLDIRLRIGGADYKITDLQYNIYPIDEIKPTDFSISIEFPDALKNQNDGWPF